MTQQVKRVRLVAIAVTALTLLLSLNALSAAPTFAAASVRQPTQPQKLEVIINGVHYLVTSGQTLRFPTTYQDGSKGWVTYTASIRSTTRSATANVRPNTNNCVTGTSQQSWTNAFGTTLASYTMGQYWCYYSSSGDITFYAQPSVTFQTSFGWSLVDSNASAQSNYGPSGKAVGTFRFNGPFGVGCKSGQNIINFYDNGFYSTQYDEGSYYGC